MNTIKLKCTFCKIEFERRKAEHNRNIKIGRFPFCNLTCSTKYSNSQRTEEFCKNIYEKQKTKFDIKSQAGNRLDEFSPFRIYLRKGRASIKNHIVEITEKDLKELWEKQKGICPYTGIKMELMKTSSQQHNFKSLKKASLDRIDSSKEYTKDNIEFVCMAINNAKNNFKKEEMISFLNEIISLRKMVELGES